MAQFEVPGFDIKLPDKYLDMSTYVFALAPSTRFQPSFVIKSEVRTEKPTVQRYASQQINILQENLQDFAVLSQTPGTQGTRELVTAIFEWGPAGEGERIRQQQWYISVPERSSFYTLTATNLAADFEQTESLFHAIVRSFRPK
jgi:hypothetical protein